ncbi:hypothetical protein AY600_09855 [Phormidium willei BDU 130791]|nr:hypothetical protein AY600_09855 [Phormidium willei BDU 130791]
MKPSFKIAVLASFAVLSASAASHAVQSSASPKPSNRLHVEIEDLTQDNLSQTSVFNKDSDSNQDYDQDYNSDRTQDYNYDHDAKTRSSRSRRMIS